MFWSIFLRNVFASFSHSPCDLVVVYLMINFRDVRLDVLRTQMSSVSAKPIIGIKVRIASSVVSSLFLMQYPRRVTLLIETKKSPPRTTPPDVPPAAVAGARGGQKRRAGGRWQDLRFRHF